MDKCTQNSENPLVKAVILTILNNVNVALCFYKKRPTTPMRISLEETIIENTTFAQLIADECHEGAYLLNLLNKLNDQVIQTSLVRGVYIPKDLEEFAKFYEAYPKDAL